MVKPAVLSWLESDRVYVGHTYVRLDYDAEHFFAVKVLGANTQEGLLVQVTERTQKTKARSRYRLPCLGRVRMNKTGVYFAFPNEPDIISKTTGCVCDSCGMSATWVVDPSPDWEKHPDHNGHSLYACDDHIEQILYYGD